MPDRQSEGNRSGLAEHEVNRPATEEVRPCAAAMAEDIRVVHACFFQGVGKDWQVREATLIVDSPRKAHHGRCKRGGEHRYLVEQVAKYFDHQRALFLKVVTEGGSQLFLEPWLKDIRRPRQIAQPFRTLGQMWPPCKCFAPRKCSVTAAKTSVNAEVDK